MKKKTKLQHHGSGGCILQLILILERTNSIRKRWFLVPIDGFIEMYDSEENREKRQ